MNKTLIKSEKEYRKFAFDILEKSNASHIQEALGVVLDTDCWDYNEKDEPIDENGNVIPDETPDSLILSEEIKSLNYPIIVVHCFEKEWDRTGDLEICVAEFVSLSDFGLTN